MHHGRSATMHLNAKPECVHHHHENRIHARESMPLDSRFLYRHLLCTRRRTSNFPPSPIRTASPERRLTERFPLTVLNYCHKDRLETIVPGLVLLLQVRYKDLAVSGNAAHQQVTSIATPPAAAPATAGWWGKVFFSTSSSLTPFLLFPILLSVHHHSGTDSQGVVHS